MTLGVTLQFVCFWFAVYRLCIHLFLHRYAEVVAADFGFSVSDRTKLFALQQSRNLSDTVVAEMAELGRSLAAARAEVAYDGDDITASALNFARASGQVRAVAADVSSSTSVQDFCDRLAAAVPKYV